MAIKIQKDFLKFALLIPILNVFADSLHGYSSGGLFSPGFVRTYLLFGFLLVSLKYIKLQGSITKTIVVSLVYYALLVFFSSDFAYSLSVFLKYFLASMMFLVGYTYIKTIGDYKKLLINMVYTLGIYTFFIIISSIFGLGSSGYSDTGDIYFGMGRVNMTKAMAMLVVISPLILRFERSRTKLTTFIFILVVSVIFIYIGVKRSAVIGLPISLLFYFLLTPYKGKLSRALLGISFLFILLFPLYMPSIEERFETRVDAGRFNPEEAEEEESRYIEILDVIYKFENDNIAKKLFGEEIFNSMEAFNTNRMLHTDYAVMFSGTGLIGYFLFLYIHYLILMKSLHIYRNSSDPELKNIAAVSMSLFVFVLIVSISGSVTTISVRSISYLFWGASFGFVDYYKSNILLKQNPS